jgi:hypothetical protein
MPCSGAQRRTQIKLAFESKAVPDVRVIETKTRDSIELKKQGIDDQLVRERRSAYCTELRALVAARYRDLIYSADSIVRMREASTALVKDLDNLLQTCDTLGRLRTSEAPASVIALGNSFSAAQAVAVNETAAEVAQGMVRQRRVLAIAKEIKHLIDTPELIWAALARNQFLYASIL